MKTDNDAQGQEKAKSRGQRKAKITKTFWAATQKSFTGIKVLFYKLS